MIYEYKITGKESEGFRLLIGSMACTGVLRPELDRPISEICVGVYKIMSDPIWTKFAGSNKKDCYKPYLAGKGDLIAFDNTVQTMVKYDVGYHYKMDGTKTLIIEPQLGSSVGTLYPLIATLMHAANDIDVSDDNFRQWLINNRPKGNKMEKMDMHEDTKNDALFKFLQLREHAGNVKITQEMGQQLFNLLVECAEAIGHEEVSGDALATDSDKFVLELVNNLINSAKPAPKPTIFERVDADEINNMPREYEECRTRLVPRWADSYIFVPVTDDVAEKCFGKPSVETREDNMWFFKVDGVLCKAFGRGQLSISVSHRPFAEVRKAFDRILEVVNEEMNEGKDKEKD